MKPFLDEDFLLQTSTAKALYHNFSSHMPIFDHHCHLHVKDIAADLIYDNLTQIWIKRDQCKWRIMRANSIPEKLITGDADDFEKFTAWAATVPMTLRNPIFHWAHMELKRPFGISNILLNPETARQIYDKCSEMLQSEEFSARNILKMMNVKVICTTNDPVEHLENHIMIRENKNFDIKVLPCFCPDMAMTAENPQAFNEWVNRLESATNIDINSHEKFIQALTERHDFFHKCGCRISNHCLETAYSEDYREREIKFCFELLRSNKSLNRIKMHKFKSAMLVEFARMDAEKNWIQQYNLGALHNTNNTSVLQQFGLDSGYDSIGNFEIARPLFKLINTLAFQKILPKTILYFLNSRDTELIANMCSNFQDSNIPGKIQFGFGYWFNDHKDGIERQINAISTTGLLSRFIGMPSDSKSLLSYSRHEYFRRILCNLIGNDVEKGEIPFDLELLGKLIRDISFNNALSYFRIEL